MADLLKFPTDDNGEELKNGYIAGGYASFDEESSGIFNTSDEVCFWNSFYNSTANFILNGNRYSARFLFNCELQTSNGFQSVEDFVEDNETEFYDQNGNPIYDITGLPLTSDGEAKVQKVKGTYFTTPPYGDTSLTVEDDIDWYKGFDEKTSLEDICAYSPIMEFREGFYDDSYEDKDLESFDKLIEDFKKSNLGITWYDFLKKLNKAAVDSIFDWGLRFKGFEVGI